MVGMIAVAVLAISSQITDVTVYNDRAQVVRTAEVDLKPGMSTVIFEDLPRGVASRGIQVDGSGDATVLDVRYIVENVEDISQEVWKEIYDKETALTREEAVVNQQIKAYRESKKFLADISSKVTSTQQQEGDPELNPESWKRMLDMVLARQMAYDAAIRKADKELKGIRKKKAKVQADMRVAGANKNRQRRLVEVDLETKNSGKTKLRLSYLVHGPSWTPTYDVRVDTKSREIDLKYYALIRQNTGEDWSQVSVKLSTANPGLGGQHPELQPWRITPSPIIQGKIVHRYVQDYDVESGQRSAPVVNTRGWDVASSQVEIPDKFVELNNGDFSVLGLESLNLRGTQASNQGTAVVFEIDGKSSIESDNAEHRVSVASSQLPAHFRYSTVPKKNATAFLKARTTNSGDYPFLAGKASIFLDGSYVTASSLDLVPPGEDFWVFLGVDQGMKVEHKLLKRYESSEGLRDRKVRYTYEYVLVIKNTHDKQEEFIIWDHLPISENEEIKVKLLEPKFTKNTTALTLDDSSRLQWLRKLEPGEELKIPFSFYIEAPKGLTIEGLN